MQNNTYINFYRCILIYRNNNLNYFHFAYNQNSTTNDLLYALGTIYNDEICPCCEVIIFNDNRKLGKQENIYNYIQQGYYQYRIINNNYCICNQSKKRNFRKTKFEILAELEETTKKLSYLEKQVENSKNENRNLTATNMYLSKELNESKRKCNELSRVFDGNKELNFEIKQLKTENENLNKTNKKYEAQNKELKFELNQIKDKNQILEKKVTECLNEFKLLGNKNDNSQKKIEQLKDEIQKQNEKNINNSKEINTLREAKKTLEQEKEKLQQKNYEDILSNNDINFLSFYDAIIGIKSIKDINKGWPIIFSENLEHNYENIKKSKVIKIGVIGNANRGKSFLLSKISKIKLPSGYSIRTEGLSIKYPEIQEYKDRKIVLLDSAGLETPVLKNENQIEEEKAEKIEKEGKTEKEEAYKEEKTEKEFFREKSREKLITELFLQNFIINNSDILIIVVGILTYSEQKLLNRIRTELLKQNKNKDKANKALYIIHNLMNYTTEKQVEEYIQEFLLKSATFELEEGHKISTSKEKKKGKYFNEKNFPQNIYHLIFAKEDTEAGNLYNDYTLELLENSYMTITNLKPFDVIESIKQNFIEISKDILEKSEKVINKDDFDNSNNKLIRLINANNVALKRCLIDELGFSNLKANGFEPTYNYYRKDKKLIIKIEAPGNSSINSITVEDVDSYKLIRIKGIKKRDKEPAKDNENLGITREFGNFLLEIVLKPDNYIIKNEDPNISEKKGVIFVEFGIEERKKGGEFIVKEEDEI